MPRLYLGTQGWSYPSWVGSFYPPGTPSTRFLDYYATQFTTVELDTTFYAIPRVSTIAGWRETTPAGFRFAAKFPQVITHEKALRGCELETGLRGRHVRPRREARPAAAPDAAIVGRGGDDRLAKFLPVLPPGSAMRSRCGTARGWRRTPSPS